jgi:hypothetical protein
MTSPFGTKIAEGFSAKILEEIYSRSLIDYIVNRDYEGEISVVGSKLNILSLAKLTEKTYNGANLTADDLTEVNASLVIDQYKSFYWKEKTLDKFLSYLKDPHSKAVVQTANERMKNMDSFVFGFYGDVAAGNRVGTDYVTGTVTITATTGAVVGSGTTFTAAMVGRGFKAVGHSKWYRVKTYTDATHIVIENDSDDEVSAYDGGALSGVAYVIEAATVLTIAAANLLSSVAAAKQKLDLADVPDEDRFLVVPPEFETVLVGATGVSLSVPAVYDELVKRGMITQLQGFQVFKSTRLTGDNTNG